MLVQSLCVNTTVAETVIVTSGFGHLTIPVAVIRKHNVIRNIISHFTDSLRFCSDLCSSFKHPVLYLQCCFTEALLQVIYFVYFF